MHYTLFRNCRVPLWSLASALFISACANTLDAPPQIVDSTFQPFVIKAKHGTTSVPFFHRVRRVGDTLEVCGAWSTIGEPRDSTMS